MGYFWLRCRRRGDVGKRSLKWEGGRRRGARTGVILGSRDGESVIFGVSTGKGRVWRNGRLCTV